MAETFPKIRQVLGGIVDRPLEDKLADLGKLADGEPQNPGYPLVMAMVSSLARHNHLDAAKHLREAGRRLKLSANAQAEGVEAQELAFAALAHEIVSVEFDLLKEKKLVRGRVQAAQIDRRAALVARGKKAIGDLEAAARKFRGSTFARVLHAGIAALSRVHGVASKEYQAAVKSLVSFSKEGEDADLARFFLVYAYRRARNYTDALPVAQKLQTRHPNSAMLRQMLGSIFSYMGDSKQAVATYKQAVSLAPKDPATHLGLAIAMERARDFKGAKAAAAEAARLDRKGQLEAPLAHLRQDLDIVEKLSRA
jgi:tetratricopeptide (TPR) repeat protein